METFLKDLCVGLVNRGIDCGAIAASSNHHSNSIHDLGVDVRLLANLATIKSLAVCPEALWALRGVDAQILNIHHPNPLADVSYLFSDFKGKLVVTYQSDTLGKGFLGQVSSPLLHYVLKRADAIITSSPHYLDSSPILQSYRKKVCIIPLGIDIKPLNRDLPYRDRPVRSIPHYLFIGRLVPYKGISVLIQALREIPCNLEIVGTGPLQPELVKLARLSGVSERVSFLGNVTEEEKLSRLAECDALILPSISRAEAYSIVLLEAMAMECPVIVSDLPSGVRMLVKDGVNGYRFEPGNAEALALTLNKLAQDPQLAAQMGRNGRRLLEENWTIERTVEKYVKLYEQVLDG